MRIVLTEEQLEDWVCLSYVAGLITTPIDVIKTKLMTDRHRSLGIVSCARDIYADEGYRGFSRGIWLRGASCGLITSVLFVSYEPIKSRISSYLGQDNILNKQ